MAKIGINIATGSLQQSEIIVWIDLGTTNSLVAIIHPDTKLPTALKEFDGSSIVPSIVHFDAFGNAEVGANAKPYLESDPANTIFSAKRLMGKSYKDIRAHQDFFAYKIIDDNRDSLVKVQVGSTFYSPVDLSSYILVELKKRAEHILKTPVTKAVITVPAYFNDTQRQATRDAGKLAGLDVLRIINEPTAASLAYGLGLDPTEEKTIAVYDLGGGTFDISILKISNGIFEVLSTNGDTYLGGDDLDRAIIEYWMKEMGVDNLEDHKNLKQELRLAAEKAKIALSNSDLFESEFAGEKISITKEVFEKFFEGAVKSKGAFKITSKETGKVIGSTRFYDYSPENDFIFIGYTFYTLNCWGKGLNVSVKKIMLDYIFDYVSKVRFHIGAENIRSQIAISRLGAEKIAEEEVIYYGEHPKLNFVYNIERVKEAN